MSSKQQTNKQRIKKMKEENKAIFSAIHGANRKEEIEQHNGKPFTSHNTPTPKTKYNRQKSKKIERGDYE